jgi:hypothetical protein
MPDHAELTPPESSYSQNLYVNALRKKDSIIPLFREEGKKLRLFGSGIYITTADRFFLVTADHIADACRRLITAYPNNASRNLPTQRFYGHKQWADVAVCELEEKLTLFGPITRDDIRDYDKLPKGMPLAALGYPETKSKLYSSTIDCTLYTILSMEEESICVFVANPNRQVRIGIHFERTNVRTGDGKLVTAPIVNGMSGGALFWIHSDGQIVPSMPKLVGVLTDWDASKQSTIVATSIGIVDTMFQKDFGVTLL